MTVTERSRIEVADNLCDRVFLREIRDGGGADRGECRRFSDEEGS